MQRSNAETSNSRSRPAFLGHWDTARQRSSSPGKPTEQDFIRDLSVVPLIYGRACFTDTMALDHRQWLAAIDDSSLGKYIRELAQGGWLRMWLRSSAGSLGDVLDWWLGLDPPMVLSSLSPELQTEMSTVVRNRRSTKTKREAFLAVTGEERFSDRLKWMDEVFCKSSSPARWQVPPTSLTLRVKRALVTRGENIRSFYRKEGGEQLLLRLQSRISGGGKALRWTRTDWFRAIDEVSSASAAARAAFKRMVTDAYLANFAAPLGMDIICSDESTEFKRGMEAAGTQLGKKLHDPNRVREFLRDPSFVSSLERLHAQVESARGAVTQPKLERALRELFSFLLRAHAKQDSKAVYDASRAKVEIRRVTTFFGTTLGAVFGGIGGLITGAATGYALGSKPLGLLHDEQILVICKWLLGEEASYTRQAAKYFHTGTARAGAS